MPVFTDHPVRLLRQRKGFSVMTLSKLSLLHRSTVSAIEEGRPRVPDFASLEQLAGPLGVDVRTLASQVEDWAAVHAEPDLPASARVALAMSPLQVTTTFPSFSAWRAQFADTVTGFSSMLGVNRKVVADFEAGRKVRGMPTPLAQALLVKLGVSDEYLVAVQGLPVGDEEA